MKTVGIVAAATVAVMMAAGGAMAQDTASVSVPDPLALNRAWIMNAAQDDLKTRSVLRWADPATMGAGPLQGDLRGYGILLKDNIETRDMPTTAGSLALADNAPGRDAPLVTRLREAGVGDPRQGQPVGMGQHPLVQLASAAGAPSAARPAIPTIPTRTPCGSSSGSAVAVADRAGARRRSAPRPTARSPVRPRSTASSGSSRPSGWSSRTHIVPISHSQDTAGPMTTHGRGRGHRPDGHRRLRSRWIPPRSRPTRARSTTAPPWTPGR